jgi:hypothetical protein
MEIKAFVVILFHGGNMALKNNSAEKYKQLKKIIGHT